MEREDLENVHHNSESQSSECLPSIASSEISEEIKRVEVTGNVDSTSLEIVGSNAASAESSFVDENLKDVQSQNLDFDHLVHFSDLPISDTLSHEESAFNVEQYDIPCLSRRGPGRPRKDGGRVRISQGKLKRGPGRPRKEDGSGILHHKIFSGRPRVRARKMHRHLFATPGSNLSRPFAPQEDANFTEDCESVYFSGSSKNELKSLSPEKVSSSKFSSFSRPRRTCSLCNLGEFSLLGQGRLKNYHPASSVISKLSPEKTASSEEKLTAYLDEKSPLKLALKKHKTFKSSRERIRIQRNKSLHNLHEKSNIPTRSEEFAAIGFLSVPNTKDVFLSSGEALVHYNCAAWSGCVKESGNELTNVDKTVCCAITQKCSKCHRYGASVKCAIPDCGKIYHFPCATVSGALQDAKKFKTVCIQHINQDSDLDIICTHCKTSGDKHQLLLCTCCKNHFHGSCVGITRDTNILLRAGWQCMHCKMCQTCKQLGDENKMLVCDSCDKKYHTFCLKPTVCSIPKSGWKCHDCRVCGDCGARTPGSGPSSRWHLKYSLCDSCYQQRNKGIACPLCGKAYRQFSRRKEMKHCTVCRKYIHVECDRRVLDIKDPSEYVCPVCVNPTQAPASNQDIGNMDSFLKGKTPEAVTSSSDFFLGSSRDSFPSANEDSCSSADSDSTSDLFSVGMEDPPVDLLNIQSSVSPNYQDLSPSRYSHHRHFPLGFKVPGKKRLGVGRPKGGGKLAGKRRAKTAEFRRKRGPKPKIKSFSISGSLCVSNSIVDTKEYKQDDEPSADNKMVLASATDQFILCQDLCVMCGSFGKEGEGRLIACSQCGQCYHSYCASIKVTEVILKKGWRCLDCTVCEGCGQPHDEGRLLLCDDCDISFHIYCLDPPLEDVPQGNWKCKWCVACVKCGTREPGYNCSWQINYTHCGPCASYYSCPLCQQNYEENDLIVQCTQCERWNHGRCDQIESEESAEKCVDYGYMCLLCRPPEEPPPHLLPPSAPPSPILAPVIEKPLSPIPKPKEPEVVAVKVKPQTQFYLDGVYLSENGMHYIKSLTPEQPKKIRARRPRQPSVGATLPNPVGTSSIVGYTPVPRPDKLEETDMLVSLFQGNSENMPDLRLDMEIKQEVDEEAKISNSDLFKDSVNDPLGEKKKRPRKVPKLGIGGFVVKPRGRSSSTKEISGEHGLLFIGEITNDSNQPNDATSTATTENKDQSSQEKPKRRRKVKKRTPLEECFPSYMQDAFFGKELLQSTKDVKQILDPGNKGESTSEDSLTVTDKSTPSEVVRVIHPPAKADLKFIAPSEECANFRSSDNGMKVHTVSVTNKEPVVMPKDVTIEDVKDLLAWSSEVPPQDNLMNVLNSSKNLSDKATGDSEMKVEKLREKSESVISFSAAISGSKMSTVLEDTGLPQMDIKDVEDVFEGVLRDQKISQPNMRLKETNGNQPTNYSTTLDSRINVAQLPNTSPFVIQRNTAQLATQSSGSRESLQSAHQQDSNSSWPESDSEHSQIQKSIVKWESDEPLGALSTISPVLYANINFPNLKIEYPNWSDRVKQIAKIWRSLPSDKRQPYLQKARENRAACRNQKSSSDGDKGMKDLKVLEIDQEKQWKQLQALRQKQQRILQEQRTQVLLKSQNDKGETFGDLEKAQAACILRATPGSASTRNEISQDPSNVKELQYSQLYGKKWNVDTSAPKLEDVHISPQLLSQNNQGTPDSAASVVRPSLPVRPPTAIGSPFIQVSRVRPPIDPNRIPITDTASLQNATLSGTSTEHYHPAQSLLAGHNITSPQRSTFSPNSPVPRQSLLISRTEISRAPTPTMHKEMLYTPPSTPRPQSSDSFFQVSVSPRTQFLVSLDTHTQTSVASHKLQNVPPTFQQSNLESCVFSTASNISNFSTSDSAGVTSSNSHIVETQPTKPLLSQPAVSAVLQNKITTQTLATPTTTDSSLKIVKIPNTPTSDHFVQQPVSEPSVDQNIALAKQIVQHKTEIYSHLPGASLPTTSLTQDRAIHSQTLEQLYVENQSLGTDQSKILSRHQLRDLLQKHQGNKVEGTVLQISSKEASQLPLQQWQQGVYNATTLQYISKDDCFRHPYPPIARARSLSAKDLKGDYPADILTGSPGDVKINSPNIDIPAVEDKNNHLSSHPHSGFLSVGLGSTASDSSKISTSVIAEALKRTPTTQKIDLPENVDPICSIAGGSIRMLETVTINRASESCKDTNVSSTPCLSEGNMPRSSIESDFLPVRIKHEVSAEIPSSPGPGKKRKTTAGDLVKDLETQPEEHDVINSDLGEELDDDELLGLGNDFNILEYADPELDKGLVGEGEKSNILDEHLDLDDKDDDLPEEEEEEIKAHTGDKALLSREVSVADKKDFISDNKDEKSNPKSEPQQDLQDDFLDFHKKEDSKRNFEGAFKLKGIDCDVEKPAVIEASRIIKKEPKLPFSSCSVPGSPFCSAEELLKSEKIHMKESPIQTQSSLAFSQGLSLSPHHHPSQAYPSPSQGPPPPPPPSYRIGNQLKQTITPTSPHLPPSQLLQDHKNVFPIHVGVSLRPNLQLVQQNLLPSSQQPKPLLLQEQPLLLEDLVEQEKREQRRQTQEGLISPQGDALLSDIDFERLKDDVFSGPPDDSIGGPGSLLSSHDPPLQSVVSPSAPAATTNNVSSHNYAPPPYSLVWQNQDGNITCSGPSRAPAVLQTVQPRAQMANVINSLGLPTSILLQGEPTLRSTQSQKATIAPSGIANHPLFPNFLPTPPTPPLDPITDQEKQQQIQYEKWLIQQQGILGSQQKYFETEVIKLRKMKKALNAKQRQLRKNGAELAENDAMDLAKICQEQGGLQKQLDQVRKQSRQHATLLQEYRLKQQKRQQQQQLTQAQIHASISSLQSSPQNSHSPHQINQAAPHSPMLPTSPMGPSPSARIQHSPSPMMHHSPAPVPPSTIITQTSPLIPSPLLGQQMSLHFPSVKTENKTWCNPLQTAQISDESISLNDRFQQREHAEKFQSGQTHQPSANVSMALLAETEVKENLERKQKTEQELSFAKRLQEQAAAASLIPNVEEQSPVLKKIEIGSQGTDRKPDTSVNAESPVPGSILAQSLPSSVTNTLNFTLRQTGMPTVCLPAGDQGSTDISSQVHYLGLSPSDKMTANSELKTLTDDAEVTRPETSNNNKVTPSESQPSTQDLPHDSLLEVKAKQSTVVSDSRNKLVTTVISQPSETVPRSIALDKLLNPTISECSELIMSAPIKDEFKKTITFRDCSLTQSHLDSKIELSMQVMKAAGVLIKEGIVSSSHQKPNVTASDLAITQYSSVSINQESRAEIQDIKNIKLEKLDEEYESQLRIQKVKMELESVEEGNFGNSICLMKEQFNSNSITKGTNNSNDGASSEEELENLAKAVEEGEHDSGKQNVLLKQLLQNCPSAETSRKPEPLTESKKEEMAVEEVPLDVGKDQLERKTDEAKVKKPTYLDIRRAQLEKEPTPPPGEAKPKRKRPKKKKPDNKEGSPVKKRCRKGSSSKVEEGYETYIETLMTQLTSLPPLRILEPNIKPNFNGLSVFGAGDLNVTESRLKGSYGNALAPQQPDIYSFYPYSKNHPSPTATFPPSSPPYRGFYNQEFSNQQKSLMKNENSTSVTPHKESLKGFRDTESPDTVISSSSPECCVIEPFSKWPELIFIDDCINPNKDEKKSYSPVIPLVTPIPIRFVPRPWKESKKFLLDYDKEKDKENIPRVESKSDTPMLKSKITGLGGYSAPLKDSGNVAVTLTLSSAAAEDICGVLSALADLLKIPIPATYEIVERTATPPSQKLGLYRKSKNSDVNIHSLLNGKPRFCRHCDIVVLSAGIRKKASDLTCISREEREEDEVIFCSTNCYMQFALTHRSTSGAEGKEAAAIVTHASENPSKADKDGPSSEQEATLKVNASDDQNLPDTSDCKLHSKDQNNSQKSNTLIIETIQPETNESNLLGIDRAISIKRELFIDDQSNLSENLVDQNNHLVVSEAQKVKDELQKVSANKKWKFVKYKYWSPSCEPAQFSSPKHNEPVANSFYHIIKPSQMPTDSRKCLFCHVVGDCKTDGSARLLNIDVDKWVHLNCALWSAEVYETVNGALMNVETAYKRAMLLVCSSCHKQGASLKCFKVRCSNTYHFSCAMKESCAFFKDKTVLCPQHVARGSIENELESVAVFRRVYVNRDEHKQVASMIQGDQYVMRIGSLIFLNIGQLLPQQIQAFHTPNCIYPVGYKIIRMYWSMRQLGRRCQYVCSINEVNGKPEFHIQVKEIDFQDILLKDKTAKGVWQKVIYPIEKMRKQAKTIKIFPDFITGDDLFGLTEPAVLRIVESLPGVDTLSDYNFRYGRSPFLELPLAINPTGCARTEPKLRTHFKRPHTLHTSNTSRSSFHSAFGGMEVSSPYIKQFVHSKSSQYRKMKTEWRNNVYLARSHIQGLGLYAARDIEKHTMVIEYIGHLIRNEIAERNEAVYDTQNRGVYMFRLDENRVIDATLSGGLARYMNHSCYPNCVAEVVQIDRENKILIIANRRISRGEELTYDYKFEVEDDQHKIPCLCGASNCRKWMN